MGWARGGVAVVFLVLVSDSLRFGCCYDIVLVVFGFCVWFGF